jgi:uncharacterized protein YfaS (alpha-2-macroglobulin family)
MSLRLLCLFTLIISQSFAGEVTLFSPEGNIKNIRQVTARFQTDMTALGDPRDLIHPFTQICEDMKGNVIAVPPSSSRWADTKNWSLDFESPLSSGVRCTFAVKEDLKDIKGEKITGRKSFSFSTSGPAVLNMLPRYSNIEPDQYFVLELDGEIDEDSLVKNAYFEVEGLNEKIAPKIITAQKEEIVKAAFHYVGKNELPAKIAKSVVIGAVRRFPEGAKVVFHWTTGILSKTGVAVVEEQSFQHEVLQPFRATFSCQRESALKACNPISVMDISFNSKIPLADLVNVKLVSGKTVVRPREILKFEKDKTAEESTTTYLTFEGPFQEKSTFALNLPGKLKDELGRTLTNAKEFPLTVRTDAYSPLIKFPARFGVIEAKTEALLPVSVRNVEKQMAMKQIEYTGKMVNISSMNQIAKIIDLYEKSLSKEEWPSESHDYRNDELLNGKEAKAFTLPKTNTENDFEMMGIKLATPGFYAVEIKSPRLGESLTSSKKPMYVHTTALVTNMSIHYKKGLESSLVWVTELDSSKPVEGAFITVTNCSGGELARGTTGKDGLVKFEKFNPTVEQAAKGCAHGERSFYVFAKKGDDLSFMNTSWGQGIESWRFQVRTENEYGREQWGPLLVHTVLDRTLFQPGETVQMKHLLREHHQNGFTLPKEKYYPKKVLIRHSGSGKVYELPFKMEAGTGSALNTFVLSKDMPLGQYEIWLSNKNLPKKTADQDENQDGDEERSFDWSALNSGNFVVSEFRLPLMNATVKIQGDYLVRTTDAKADLSAQYMSGGPASKLNVKTRTQIVPSYFVPDFFGSDEFTFFTDPVKTGIVSKDDVEEKAEAIKNTELTLDSKGGALLEVKGLSVFDRPKSLEVEMEYMDPNGEVKTARAGKVILPSKAIVGLRTDSWFGNSSSTKLIGVVSSPAGKLLSGVKYKVEAFKSQRYSHRKRIVGGFYSYDSKTEIKSLGVVCEGTSDVKGRFECVPSKLPPGDLLIQASVEDEDQAKSFANVNVNIFENGEDFWWTPGDSDRIDVLPEKKVFAPNETAKFVVKTPFKEATALVTVEREGVLDQFVTVVKRENPVVEVPMKGHYAPNVFVSVMLVRGRVSEPKPDFLVDLGKPAMKMGIAEIKVGVDSHRLKIDVSTDKNRYNVKEKATVTIKLHAPDENKLPKNTEVILAVVDESLLHLKNNESFDLLSAMMSARGLAVESSSGINQVIGRRHFGLKAKAPGGGGGAMSGPREHFDPLIAFIPNLKVNQDGVVETKIQLNDSITSFRVVAIAHAGADLFGTGKTNIVTNKDLILYSGISPVARFGDQIQNVFTVRNTTEKVMKVKFEANLTGGGALPEIPGMALNPSESKVITLPITVPENISELAYKVKAVDVEGGATDEISVKEKISTAVPERVLQATLFQLDKTSTLPVKQPDDALPQSGKVMVEARASLVSGLSGVKAYMEEYPYSCLEQRTSKAITLDNKKEVRSIIEKLPSFIDDDGLLKFFDWPLGCGSSALSHYVLDILDENKYDIPDATQDALVDGLKKYLDGKSTCLSWWYDRTKDPFIDQKKIQALETLSRYNNFNEKVLETIKVTPNLWNTETLINWLNILNKEKAIKNRDELLKNAKGILRARINFQGSQMNLQESLNREGSWMLFTSEDQDALGAFNQLMGDSVGEDAGRMARGILARLKSGHWDTTMANAWGMTYMKKFSEKFEKTKPQGTTKISSPDQSLSVDWAKTTKGDKKNLTWPKDSQGKDVQVTFEHNGAGKPWVLIQTSSAIPLKSPMNFGYAITKNVTAVDQKKKGEWSVGDIVNVELVVKAGSDQSWVVINDPLPSGASHLGTGLEGESKLMNKAPVANDGISGWPLEYEEKGFSKYVAYAGYLPAGTYKVNYRYRVNSAGKFKLPPTRAEALYSPEVFGEIPNGDMNVAP